MLLAVKPGQVRRTGSFFHFILFFSPFPYHSRRIVLLLFFNNFLLLFLLLLFSPGSVRRPSGGGRPAAFCPGSEGGRPRGTQSRKNGAPPSAPAPLGPGPPRARGPSRAAARGAAAAVCWVPPLQFQNSGKSCQVTLTGASSCKTRRKESLPRRRLASLVSVLTETEAKPRCCCSLLSTAGTKNPRPRACHTSTRKSPSLCLQPCSARRTLRTSATRQEDKALLLPLRWQLLPSSCGFTLAVQPPLISRARAIGTSATAIPTRGFYLLQRSLESLY